MSTRRQPAGDPQQVHDHLDALSRTRALTEPESLELERAIYWMGQRAPVMLRWTPREDAVIRTGLANGWCFRDIAEHLGKSYRSVQMRSHRIGLRGVAS